MEKEGKEKRRKKGEEQKEEGEGREEGINESGRKIGRFE